jgi:putative protease
MAVMELKNFGVNRVLGHIELDRKSLEELRDKSVLPLEVYRLGRVVLLNSRAEVSIDGIIKDARNNQFVVKKDNRSRLTKIYSQEIMSIPRIEKTFDYYDLQNANWNAKETSKFNFDLDLL